MKRILPAALAMLTLVGPAFAQVSCGDVGQSELQAIVDIFNSPFALAIGLLVAVVGIWTWFVGQNTGRGIILLVLGVVVTAFPSLYKGVRYDLYGIPKDLGGSGKYSDFAIYTAGGDC